MKQTILMKVTSRGRLPELTKCIQAYIDMANNTKNMVWLFSFDVDDNDYNSISVTDSISHMINGNTTIVFGESTDKINAINRDVNEFEQKWDILLNISDDQLPIVKGYDDYIRKSFNQAGSLDFSIWFNDGHQDRISTQEILGYDYYQRDKFIYDPRFKSFFCDNLSNALAKKRRRQIKNTKCIIKHFHPAWEKDTHMVQDELYKRNDTYWKVDQEMYNIAFKQI